MQRRGSGGEISIQRDSREEGIYNRYRKGDAAFTACAPIRR
jgi:hypothetical protein